MTMHEKHQLQKERQQAYERAREVLDGKGEHERLSYRERKTFDKHFDEFKRLGRELQSLEPAHEPVGRGAFYQTNDNDVETRDSNTRGMRMDRKVKEAVTRYIRTGETRAADQSIGVKADGGALASTGFFPELQRTLDAFGGVRGTRARRFVTSHGRAFSVPALDDVAQKASQVAEGSTIGSVGKLQFSDVKFRAFTFQSGPVTVSHEQLMDSELDIAEVVMGSLSERIARATEELFASSTATSSTGINGLITLSTGAVSMGAGSSNLTLDLVRSLHFSIDPAYREQGEWAVSDSALQALADLEDADGRPLIEPDIREGLAGRLYGKPVRIVQDLGDIASSSQFPIMFGDFRRAYGIRDVSEVRLQRLDELYARQRRVGFLAWHRVDARPLLSSTVAPANRPVRSLKTT